MTATNTSSSVRKISKWAAEAVRAGTLAGLGMIPFAAVFRLRGLRINEYGHKTLELVVTDAPPALHYLLTLLQHLLVSWVVALPVLPLLTGVRSLFTRAVVGTVYGALFYVVVNSLALPIAFGDPTPWELGLDVIYPSLTVHLVYGVVLGMAVREQVR